MRITENQAGALTFAALDGHITSQEAIELGFGPATCGILETTDYSPERVNTAMIIRAADHNND
jgi:hypothetical protein